MSNRCQCGGKLKASYYKHFMDGWRCIMSCSKSKWEVIGGGAFCTKRDAYYDAKEKLFKQEQELKQDE